jgi:glutathione synthase/RimK-type ligase-like ATP-grasp enzyme
MTTKLAIHDRPGSFSDRWIKYCSGNKIDYKIVNCYDSNIVEQLNGLNGLLWHWPQNKYAAQLVARQIIASIEKMGIKVFPDTSTCWHYDDKVGQKYLLESIGAPLVPSYVFFDKNEAMEWIDKTEFPKVFKLRSGAGSQNVKLVKTKREAETLCRKSFGKGFVPISGYFGDAKTKIRKIKSMDQFMEKLKRLPNTAINILTARRLFPKEKGYIYFQDFLPDNRFDTRITIIGNRAFGFTRNTRPNDFRASGSGDIDYNLNRIDEQCVKLSFNIVERLKTQSLAFDFIFDEVKNPKIGEISYCYQNKAVHDCSGFWDKDMKWHEGHLWPEDAIIEDLLREIFL